MFFLSSLVLASSAALIAAAPAAPPSVPGHVHVYPDEILLLGNGRHQVMKRSEFAALEAARKNPPPMPAWMNTSIPTLYGGKYIPAIGEETKPTLAKRDKKETIYVIGPESPKFLDWDVATTITMCSTGGYYNSFGTYTTTSIANSVSVGGGVDLKLVKAVLGFSLSTDYSRTWTDSKTITTTMYVPKDRCGVAVLNPWTYRSSGFVWSGNVGQSEGDNAGSMTEYQADRHDNKKYDSFSWVDGIMSVCSTPMVNGTIVPVPRCIGQGFL